MKTLIVEDDFTGRILLQQILLPYGDAHIAVNGLEAVSAYEQSLAQKDPYHLICLDILMPGGMDGKAVLREIRRIEDEQGIMPGDGAKVIMVTGISDKESIMSSFKDQCDAYLVKPINRAKLIEHLQSFTLI